MAYLPEARPAAGLWGKEPVNPIRIPACFDLAQTLDCGQAFRWRETGGQWEGSAGTHYLRLQKDGDSLLLFCSPQVFDGFWKNYFDLEEDYAEKQKAISARHPVLKKAVSFAPGIRILRQDPWEALCSFLISQNNNIPRIKGILDALCRKYGKPIPGSDACAFPSPQTLASLCEEDLALLRAGYRAKYLIDAGRKVAAGEIDFAKIENSPTAFGREELQKIAGVGPKVAECVLLYGFHKTECFPMDVWMKRAMAVLLPGVPPEDFGENAGLAQQYIFHYSRMHPELF